MEPKDFVFHKPPRDHMTHPHGARAHQLIEQVLISTAKAASSRGMQFYRSPQTSSTRPGLFRNTGLVFRRELPEGTIQVPLLQSVVELVRDYPENKRLRPSNKMRSLTQIQEILDHFRKKHHGRMYEGCGLMFNDLNQVLMTLLTTLDRWCVGQVAVFPQEVLGPAAERDQANVVLVLKDEQEDANGYDYQITFSWFGPDRFDRRLREACGLL